MSGKQWSIAKRSLFEPFLSYCLSSLSLLPIHVDSIAAPYEYSIHIFQKWFPTFSISDRVVWPIWYLFVKITFTCRKNIFDIFAIKSSAILKEQSMLVCFGILPEKTHTPRCKGFPLIIWFLTCVESNPWVPTEPLQGVVRNRLNSNCFVKVLALLY